MIHLDIKHFLRNTEKQPMKSMYRNFKFVGFKEQKNKLQTI